MNLEFLSDREQEKLMVRQLEERKFNCLSLDFKQHLVWNFQDQKDSFFNPHLRMWCVCVLLLFNY